MFHYIPKFCYGFMFSMGVRIKQKGKFPDGGPFVIMSNHGSFIDPFIIPPSLQGEYTAIVAAKNYKIPLFSNLLRALKAVPVQRGNKQSARESIQFAEKVIHEDGYHMVILPEGTRTLDGKLQPFKKGGFHMAINTKTSILPIAVKGLFQIKPKNRWSISPQQATMIIGNPITVDNKEISAIIKELKFFYLQHGFSF